MTHWIWQHPDWPHFTWRENELFHLATEARQWQGKLLGMTRLLDADLSLEAQAIILIEDGINTSAIEGEKIDLASIRSSVARHLGLPTPSSPIPARNIDGLVELLLDATRNYSTPLTLERLCGWQAALFPTGYSGLYQIKVGTLRGDEPMRVVSGPIGREKIHFEAPPRAGLAEQVTQFLEWFNTPTHNLNGLLRAGIAHLWFVTLHPFEDGNGRLARAVTDMAITQDEKYNSRLFSLSTQIMRNRQGYYDILEKTQQNALDITDWLKWFLTQIINACQFTEKTIDGVLAKARFWLQHKNTPLNERQRKILNRMLDAMPEGFAGGMNARKYMSLTKTSRATASRELHDLVERGCLTQTGSGRSVSYVLRGDF